MAKRWTIKELGEVSHKQFIQIILSEKLDSLTNPYSPLSQRIEQAKEWLEWLATTARLP